MEDNKNVSSRKFDRRMYFFVMLIIIAIVGFLGVYIVKLEKENAVKNFDELGSNYTKQTVKSLLHWAEEQKKRAMIIAMEPSIIEACVEPQDVAKKEKAQAFIKSINNQNEEIEDVLVIYAGDESFIEHIDAKATLITKGDYLLDSSGGDMIGKSATGKSFYEKIKEGAPYYYSEIYGSVFNSEPIFTISIPIVQDEKVVGVSLVTTKTRIFSEKFLDSTKYKDTGYLFIVDEKKNIIAHPEKKYILKGNRVESLFEDITDNVLSGQTNFEAAFLGVRGHYVSRVVIESEDVSTKWYVVFCIEDEELFETANNMRGFLLGNALFGMVVISAIVLIAINNYQVKLDEISLKKANEELNKEINRQTTELYMLAKSDSLTGLYNHNAIFKILKRKIEEVERNGRPLSIILFDLDHFKSVNDTYGHLVGDEVIVKVARTIKSEIRETDYIGRYGGEEFLIILDTPLVTALSRAEHFRKTIESLNWSEKKLHVTASFGVKEYEKENLKEMINAADSMLYKAKKKGRNRVES